MESWLKHIFLKRIVLITAALSSLQFSTAVFANDSGEYQGKLDKIILPDLERRTISESNIDSENFEVGVFGGIMNVEDFGSNPVFGMRLAYHATEDFFLEMSYGQTTTSETSFEQLSGSAQLLSDDQRELTYYDLSVGYHLLPGEVFIGRKLAFNTNLYLIVGAGNTDFAGDSYFTYNFGAGYRFYCNDWMSIHLDVRDHMFNTDLLGEEKMTHNLEFQTGITIFF